MIPQSFQQFDQLCVAAVNVSNYVKWPTLFELIIPELFPDHLNYCVYFFWPAKLIYFAKAFRFKSGKSFPQIPIWFSATLGDRFLSVRAFVLSIITLSGRLRII